MRVLGCEGVREAHPRRREAAKLSSASDNLLVPRKVDVRLPGKGNTNAHGARPVHLIITTIKWIRTSRSLSGWEAHPRRREAAKLSSASAHKCAVVPRRARI